MEQLCGGDSPLHPSVLTLLLSSLYFPRFPAGRRARLPCWWAPSPTTCACWRCPSCASRRCASPRPRAPASSRRGGGVAGGEGWPGCGEGVGVAGGEGWEWLWPAAAAGAAACKCGAAGGRSGGDGCCECCCCRRHGREGRLGQVGAASQHAMYGPAWQGGAFAHQCGEAAMAHNGRVTWPWRAATVACVDGAPRRQQEGRPAQSRLLLVVNGRCCRHQQQQQAWLHPASSGAQLGLPSPQAAVTVTEGGRQPSRFLPLPHTGHSVRCSMGGSAAAAGGSCHELGSGSPLSLASSRPQPAQGPAGRRGGGRGSTPLTGWPWWPSHHPLPRPPPLPF